jgi:hypothetical protein
MKLKSKPKTRRRTAKTFRGREYSLSNAKTFLGRLLDKAKRGEDVVIYRGSERFGLHEIRAIEPIPIRPPGYFRFDEEDLALDRMFSKANVPPNPKDFE